ncbi:MAG: hypothetical protein IJX94_01355 [Clostridia bacterium]|nr:hypothetical protein [Clostridia bacterium]
MKVYEIGFSQVADAMKEITQTGGEGLIVEIAADPWLATGRIDGTYSEEARQDLGIPLFHAKHYGGTCVVFPGDLSLCEMRLTQSDFGKRAIHAVKEFLKSLGLHVALDGNDLMLYSPEENEKFKVASYGSGSFGGGHYQTVVHVSIGMDEELVKRLCTKNQKKKPRGLDRYGVTAQAVYEVIKPLITV